MRSHQKRIERPNHRKSFTFYGQEQPKRHKRPTLPRQKLSDQSDQKKLKTVELYANYYDVFQQQNTDNQSECRRSPLAWIPGNTGTLVPTVLFWFLLYIKMSTEKLIAAVAGHPVLYDPRLFLISETIQYRNNQA